MSGKLPPGRITISVGEPSNLGKSTDRKVAIRDLPTYFNKPVVTPEKYHQFKSFGQKKQNQLKGRAGWFIPCSIPGGVRNRQSIQPRTLITYDLDNLTPAFAETILSGELLPGYAMLAHTTRSHTPENPRFRIMLFASEKIKPDDYSRVSRIIGLLIDPDQEYIDHVSFRPAQMMYLPTCSSDMEKHFRYHQQGGDEIDWKAVVDQWEEETGNDSNDIRALPTWPGEANLREIADEAEDPLEKKGPVGDFCRAWSITDLIQGQEDEDGNEIPGPLADKYQIDDWEDGAASRMTYLEGHSVNGAVVYGDKFIYSHHGSDPCSDMLVNAYDAVRIHLFGDKDKGEDEDTPMKDRPSVKKMAEYIQTDPFFKAAQVESRYGALDEYLDDEDAYGEDDDDDDDDLLGASDLEDNLDDPEADDLLGVSYRKTKTQEDAVLEVRRRKAPKPPKGWIRDLNKTDDGIIKKMSVNCASIVRCDPRLWRKIAWNELKNGLVLLDDIDFKNKELTPIPCRDKVYGDNWQDQWSILISMMMQRESGKKGGGYDISFADKDVYQGITAASLHNAFHPIKDYFDSVKNLEPDVEALETLLIRHLKAEDNQYTRDVTRIVAIASVARIEEPGCKFDTAPILESVQGVGKSTFIKTLYGAQFFGELDGDVSNPQRNAESMKGKWAMELPELSSLHKSETNDMKAFITKQDDSVRMAYGREVAELPRQCVFWGTTNDSDYLRDATGNRRYLPLPLNLTEDDFIDQMAVLEERDVFWATAHYLYRQMREEHPRGDLPLTLYGESLDYARNMQQERRKEEPSDQWAERIKTIAEDVISVEQLLTETELKKPLTEVEPGTQVQRIAFTMTSFLAATEQRSLANQQSQNTWVSAVKNLVSSGEWIKPPKNTIRIRGEQRSWLIRADATEEERQLGFRVVGDPIDPLAELDEDDQDDNDLL